VSKEKVLEALARHLPSCAANGRVAATVQKLDVPVEATTSSLEALKAYSMEFPRRSAESLLFFKRAVELDPNFALPYAGMDMCTAASMRTAYA